jgi:DNA-binding PadR family transcriptional regulator
MAFDRRLKNADKKTPPSVSNTEAAILQMLAEHGELYGLEMISKNSALKRGTIYVTLDRLEDKGLISSRTVEPPPGSRGPARRLYKITGLGGHVVNIRRMIASAWSGYLATGGVN